ncbi:MAG: nitroreductase family protein [Coprobacillus sp.]|nr:nitroreductase family protein [Coprobacillus sp.]
MSDPIFARCSTRRYTDEEVSEEDIELLLKAGMQAPSACNQQPWEFYVVRDKDIKPKLSANKDGIRMLTNANVVIVPCYIKKIKVPFFQAQDLGASVENILIEAEQLNLGACWMGVEPIPDRVDLVRKTLDIPDTLEPFCLIPIGHKAEQKKIEDRYKIDKVHKVY